jgi:hypothetical protein
LKEEGLREEVRVSVGDAFVTTCVAVPVAELLVVSPPYDAVITSDPTGSRVVVIVTTPLEEVIVPLPSVTPPLVIVMVPVGPTGTEAVIVTDWPKMLEPDVLTVTVGVVFATVCVTVATEEL